MAESLIDAKLWLLGLDAQRRPIWRHDATIRVDGGMVAQIGAFEAVAYGVDLPRYGDARGFALPLFAPPAPDSLSAAFGGVIGRLTPGSPAHLALFPADGPPPSRRAFPAAQIFLDGLPVPETVWRPLLEGSETPEEAALWAAAARGPD